MCFLPASQNWMQKQKRHLRPCYVLATLVLLVPLSQLPKYSEFEGVACLARGFDF